MRIQIVTNPNRAERNVININRSNELPNVSTTLKPVDEEVANLEAELGELVVSPDLMNLYRVGGKRHSQGGTKLNIEEDSFIFSRDNSMAIPKKQQEAFGFKLGGSAKKYNTPAKLVERQINIENHNQMSGILSDVKNRDVTAKNTAKEMLQKNQEYLGQIAFLQEAKKEFKQGTPKFSEGTEPIFSENTKTSIDTSKQYAQLGGNKYGVAFDGKRLNYVFNRNELTPPATMPSNTTSTNSIDLNDPKQVRAAIQKLPYGNVLTNLINKVCEECTEEEKKVIVEEAKKAPKIVTPNVPQKNPRVIQPVDNFIPNKERQRITGEYTVKRPTPIDKFAPQSILEATNTSPKKLSDIQQAEIDNPGSEYTNQKVPFNTGQILSLFGSLAINSTRKYLYPNSLRDSFKSLESQLLNPNLALRQNADNYLQFQRIGALSGNNAMAQKAFTESMDNANKIRSQYDSGNVEIQNAQNDYNNRGFNAVNARNVQNNNNYNVLTDTTVGRINEQKINDSTEYLNKFIGYYGQNQQMQHALSTMPQYPMKDKNGNYITNAVGKRMYNTAYSPDWMGNFKFNGVDGWNMPQSQKQGIFDEEISNLRQAINGTTDEKAQSVLYNSLIKLLVNKETPYRNKYGGYIKRK